jgi:hypothetical protein
MFRSMSEPLSISVFMCECKRRAQVRRSGLVAMVAPLLYCSSNPAPPQAHATLSLSRCIAVWTCSAAGWPPKGTQRNRIIYKIIEIYVLNLFCHAYFNGELRKLIFCAVKDNLQRFNWIFFGNISGKSTNNF